jgi:RNA polymerase sigma-70 factor, ECF subfamily
VSRKPDAAAATEELFALYKEDVYRYARFTLGSASDAEDIVQEVFLRVLKNWDRFRGDAHPKTWLWSITRRCIIDRARKLEKDKNTTTFDERLGGRIDNNASEALEVEDLLQTLSQDQREVVTLRLIQDWSTTDTARILGWSESKVKTTLHRAVTKMRQGEGREYGV